MKEELVSLDKKGRVLIPSEFRKGLLVDKFIIKKQNSELILKPITPPTKLFGIWAKKKAPEFKHSEEAEHVFD
jgi:bifunctional DNA-binding transcriptional regulator/antitoxin component of YhaV-PrlF toxin-antitoxin module